MMTAREAIKLVTKENLDDLDVPIAVDLRPSDIRDLYDLVCSFPLKISGLPSLAEWEAICRMRRIREQFDEALERCGLPPLETLSEAGAAAVGE